MRIQIAGLFLGLSFFATVGCMKKMALATPDVPDGRSVQDPLQESLFKGDQQLLSNQDIDRILGARVTVGDRHRLAVLGLTPRNAWSQELAEIEHQNSTRFLKALESAKQLTRVQIMPALLVPEKRTVPYLREAAARFQADLLLIYSTRVRTFQRDRLLGSDEVRANCLAESVLLDVRTGIVVHTGQTSESIVAKKAPGDLNFAETIAKAEGDATGRVLVKLANAVSSYLSDNSAAGFEE